MERLHSEKSAMFVAAYRVNIKHRTPPRVQLYGACLKLSTSNSTGVDLPQESKKPPTAVGGWFRSNLQKHDTINPAREARPEDPGPQMGHISLGN